MTTTPTSIPTPTATTAPLGTRITAWIAIVLGVAETGLAVWAWVETASYSGESSTAAVGFVVALLVGIPGGCALVLGVIGLAVARRMAGLPLAILGVTVAAGPVVLWLSAWSPWL